MQPAPRILIRNITPGDAPAAAELSGELGYPVAAEEMRERIVALAGQPDHTVLVACAGDLVVGWIDLNVVNHLQAERYAEIGGLVVAEGYRGAGIGRQLTLRGEEWARERGIAKMVVRSRVTREDAHRFYLRDGYERTKTSAVFSKKLG